AFVGVVRKTDGAFVTFEVLKAIKATKEHDLVPISWEDTDCASRPQPDEVWYYSRLIKGSGYRPGKAAPNDVVITADLRSHGVMVRDQCGSVTEPAATQVEKEFGYDIAN